MLPNAVAIELTVGGPDVSTRITPSINAALARLLLEAAFWQDELPGGSSLEPEALRSGAEFVQVISSEASADEPFAAAGLLDIKRGLLALLGLDGAIGAAVVDVDRSACSLHVSLDPRFAETAVRAGRVATTLRPPWGGGLMKSPSCDCSPYS